MQDEPFVSALAKSAILAVMIGITSAAPVLSAKDSANIPSEVLNGWRELAKQRSTFRAIWFILQADGSENSQVAVVSRLNSKYYKSDNLRKNDSKLLLQGDLQWTDKISSVLLFDADEYFWIERPKAAGEYRLSQVGKGVSLAPALGVGRVQSTSAFDTDLLEAYDSSTDEFTHYEKRDGKVQLTLNITPDVHAGAATAIIELDPEHSFRVVSATRVYQSTPNVRNVAKYEYGEHLALPSKRTFDIELQTPGTNHWKSAGGRYPFTEYWIITPDQPQRSSEFSLEHYGLPPFRKRHWSPWPMIAIVAAAIVLTSVALYFWRCRYAAN